MNRIADFLSWSGRIAIVAASSLILSCSAAPGASDAADESSSAAAARAPGNTVDGTAWVTRAPMPTARNAFGIAELNGKIYVAGGWTDGVSDVLEVYDAVRGTWSTAAPMPTARNALAAVALDGRIYAMGGWDGAAVSDVVEVYDPRTDTWSAGASMHAPMSSFGAAVHRGKIYAAGGATVQVYDPRTDAWSGTASTGWMSRFFPALAVASGKLYAIGGCEGRDALAVGAIYDVVQSYDPASDSWSDEPPMPFPRAMHAAATIGDTIFVVGGTNDGWAVWNSPFLAAVDAFQAALGRWSPRGPMGDGRNALGAAVANGRLFAIGGWHWTNIDEGATAAAATVEAFAFPEADVVVEDAPCVVWLNMLYPDGFPMGEFGSGSLITVPHDASGRIQVTCKGTAFNDTGDWVVLGPDDYPGIGCFVFSDWLPTVYEWVQYIAPDGEATLVCTY